MTTNPRLYSENVPAYIGQKIEKLQEHARHIANLEAQLDIHRTEYASIEAELLPFRIQAVGDKWTSVASPAAPIHRCSNEVLHYIFEYYVTSFHTYIRRLLLVCKRWYSLVMGSPGLWAHLRISGVLDHNFIESGPSHRYLTACMERSQGLPMAVVLWMPGYGDVAEFISSRVKDYALSMINPAQHSALERSIYQQDWEYNSPQYDAHMDQAFHRLFGVNKEHIARWGALHICLPEDTRYAAELWGRFKSGAPNLSSLILEESPPTWLVDDDWTLLGLTGLSSLVSLKICSDVSLSPFGLVPSRLRHLALQIDPDLKNFAELSIFTSLCRLKLSCLVSYCEEAAPIFAPVPAGLTSLPMLTDLVIDNHYAILRHVDFDLPTLVNLHVCTWDEFYPLPRVSPKHIRWEMYMRGWTINCDNVLMTVASLLLLSKTTTTLCVEKEYRSLALRVAARCWVEGKIPALTHILIARAGSERPLEKIDIDDVYELVERSDLQQLSHTPRICTEENYPLTIYSHEFMAEMVADH
jgi:hypothetical protein